MRICMDGKYVLQTGKMVTESGGLRDAFYCITWTMVDSRVMITQLFEIPEFCLNLSASLESSTRYFLQYELSSFGINGFVWEWYIAMWFDFRFFLGLYLEALQCE